MTSDPLKNLFHIAPGVPFLKTFASDLLDGKIIEDFSFQPDQPHLLARALIYVPTRRAVRSLRAEIAQKIGKGSVILPDIRALGETDDDFDFFDQLPSDDISPYQPISSTQSKMVLAELILAWKQSLPTIFDAQLKSAPLVAPANPADALWLASDLVSLIQSAESEEIDLSMIDEIDADDHAQWWQLTIEFLKILRQFWPARLEELHRQSATTYQIAQIDRQTQMIAQLGHEGPVIVAGSTGSLPATARLMKAVVKLDQGAVILPGLDQAMTSSQWQTLFDAAQNKALAHGQENRALSARNDPLMPVVLQGHPQFGLARLLTRLEMGVDDLFAVTPIGQAPSHLKMREDIMSKAMLPSSHTDKWALMAGPDHQDGDDQMRADEMAAMAHVSLIEAANERDEAASIAIAIRMALEPKADKDKPDVALVTPDRNLGRRVSVELLKYGIEADDSGGMSLTQTKLGGLLKLACDFSFNQPDNLKLAALLKHPLAHLGWEKEQRLLALSGLERLVLRRFDKVLDPRDLPHWVEQALDALDEARHVPQWLGDIKAHKDLQLEFARHIGHLFDTLFKDSNGQSMSLAAFSKQVAPLSFWVEKTVWLMDALTKSGTQTYEVWDNDAGTMLIELIEELRACPISLAISGAEWAQMIEPLLYGSVVKPKTGSHPRVMIWGALEARLQRVDTLIMAGLNEGIWPSTSANDPFLSRTMKSEIGLEPPERRLGLSAHDFQMGMGADHVILSRSLKSNGAPAVASRWVQRLLTVLDAATVKAMRERGAQLNFHAQMSPDPKAVTNILRPNPKLAASDQPISFSFSEVSTLRRDPYAIYAKRILKLDPMEDFASEPDLRTRGTIYHAVVEAFSRRFDDIPEGEHLEHLAHLFDEIFQSYDVPLETSFLWRNRFMQVAPHLVSWELSRAQYVTARYVEQSAKAMPIEGTDIEIGGLADRIDLLSDGSVEILDFKTGTMPSAKEARTLLDPQLPLEAYILAKGGFSGLGKEIATSLKYVRLKPDDHLIVDQVEAKPTSKDNEPRSAIQLGHQAARELVRLVEGLRSGEYGYLSRAIPKLERDMSGDYDHLARVAEWSVTEHSDAADEHG